MERFTEDVARAILKEAQTGGYLDSLPSDTEELIETAHYWADEAIKINKTGKLKGDKTVIAIVNIVNTHRFFTDEPDGSSVAELGIEKGLPVPNENLGEPSEMPANLIQLSDEELRFYSGEYNYYLGRARYLLAIYENQLSDAVHLRDDALRKASKKFIENYEGKPTKDLIEIYAKENEDYIKYESEARHHQKNANAYKSLVNIYSSNIDRLSREATMRHNEWERLR